MIYTISLEKQINYSGSKYKFRKVNILYEI